MIGMCESMLYRSKYNVERETDERLAEAIFITALALQIALYEEDTADWADYYVERTYRRNKFRSWRADATDLYAAIWGLSQRENVPIDDIERWLKRPRDKSTVRRFFMRLADQLDIDNPSLRSMRRLIMSWTDLSVYEQKLAMTRLLQILRARYQRSELLPQLTKISRRHNLEIKGVHNAETGEDPTRLHVNKQPKKKSNGLAKAAAAVAGFGVGYALTKPKK